MAAARYDHRNEGRAVDRKMKTWPHIAITMAGALQAKKDWTRVEK